MDAKAIKAAIMQICDEKGLAYDSVVETLNSALAAAYRKDFGNKNQNITFEYDLETGKSRVFDSKTVVDFPEDILKEIEENGIDKKFVKIIGGEPVEVKEVEEKKEGESSVEPIAKEGKDYDDVRDEELPEGAEVIRYNPKTDMLLSEAKKTKKSSKVGDVIVTDLEIPADFGRMAAQTAKQVIIQKLREAERDAIFEEYKDKQDKLVIGIIQRREPNFVLVDFGKMSAIMPLDEQTRTERYAPGQRMKFYVVSIQKGVKGPEMIVSRAHPKMLERLFEIEIPEVASGAISIMAIAREAGARSKIAVKSNEENIDPIGSCVGQRGTRIQTIITELNGEKIDIIEYAADAEKFIANALSPAKVVSIKVDKEEKTASVIVREDQLSLAIGRDGQNVRLAAKLTGWKINILKEDPEGKIEEVAIDHSTGLGAGVEISENVEEVAKEGGSASVKTSADAGALADKTADDGKKVKKIKKAKKTKKEE